MNATPSGNGVRNLMTGDGDARLKPVANTTATTAETTAAAMAGMARLVLDGRVVEPDALADAAAGDASSPAAPSSMSSRARPM